MWWAAWAKALAGHPGPLVRQVELALNRRKTANADGGPAANGFEKNLKQLVAEYERTEWRRRKLQPDSTFLRSRP